MKWTSSLKAQTTTTFQHEINHFNSPMAIKEIELVILKFPQRKYPDPEGSNREFYQMHKELKHQFYTMSSRKKKEGALPNSFYEANITPQYRNQR